MADAVSVGASRSAIGRGVERVEDLRRLAGRGRYVDDITLAGTLHAAVLRSSVAHGVIRAIDVSAALNLSGAHAVITAADIARTRQGKTPPIPLRQEALPELAPFEQPVIAERKVRYVGEPIAVALAENAARAEDALEAIFVTIEPRPAIGDPRAAGRESPLLFETTGTNCAITLSAIRGNAGAAFAGAPYTRRERFRVHRHTAVPMETRGVIAG